MTKDYPTVGAFYRNSHTGGVVKITQVIFDEDGCLVSFQNVESGEKETLTVKDFFSTEGVIEDGSLSVPRYVQVLEPFTLKQVPTSDLIKELSSRSEEIINEYLCNISERVFLSDYQVGLIHFDVNEETLEEVKVFNPSHSFENREEAVNMLHSIQRIAPNPNSYTILQRMLVFESLDS